VNNWFKVTLLISIRSGTTKCDVNSVMAETLLEAGGYRDGS
jgi:hypothetical protein